MNTECIRNFRVVTGMLAATSGLVMAQAAMAQSESPASTDQDQASGLQDIIVTARRTGESIQRTPVSITAFTTDDLRTQVIQGVGDLQRSTPSLQTQTNVSSGAGIQISMRGQVQTDTSANSANSVGVYIDDVFMGGSSLVGGLFNVEDLERIEVLKGPQGTLYGRNVTGGVVKFVTTKPENEFNAAITGGFGNYDRRYLSGMINIPILQDGIALRVNGAFEERDGFSRDIRSDRDLENLHRWNVRAALKLDPTENLSVLIQGWYARGRDNGPDVRTNYLQPGLTTTALNVMAAEGINGLSPAALAPLIFGAAGGFTEDQINAAAAAAMAALPAAQQFVRDAANAPRKRVEGSPLFPQYSRAKSAGGAGTIAWDFGDVTLRSITAYDYSLSGRGFNVGGGPYVPLFTNMRGSISQFSQEFQAIGSAVDGRLTYALGLYYLNSNLTDTRADSNQDGAFPLFLGQHGLGVTNGSFQTNRFHVVSKAAYGQASFAITPTINVTGGLRYTNEKTDASTFAFVRPTPASPFDTCFGPAPATPTTPLDECGQSQSVKADNLSYTIGADWTVTPGVMLYAKSSRGFKAGSVNAFPPSYGPYNSYRPETNTDYEVGLKSEFLDRKVRFNAAYYHTIYKDIQRTITIEVGPNQVATSTQNAASAKIDGVELELQVVPTRGLTLAATGSYTDARFDSYFLAAPSSAGFPNNVQDVSSQPFQTVAKYVYSLSGTYSFDIGDNTVTAQAAWAHRSSANLYPSDNFPSTNGGSDFSPISETTQKAYGVLNGSLSVDVPAYHATLTVWGKNILNKRYAQTISGVVNAGLGLAFANYGPPATFGVDLTFRYR